MAGYEETIFYTDTTEEPQMTLRPEQLKNGTAIHRAGVASLGTGLWICENQADILSALYWGQVGSDFLTF